ncbi:MAG: hypothetical protein U9R05_10565 [Chloroflexota bacterium]|nr:hypothetical protein [Chloroflexota bacterium]
MKRYTTLKHWLAVLVILFAPPFLAGGAMQVLLGLIYGVFPSASLLIWLGIEGFAIAVLGAHILISAGLMALLTRRWEQNERWHFILIGVAVPLAMPFLAYWPLSLLLRLSYRLFPSFSTPGVFFGMGAYPFLSASLLSDVTRYVLLSLAALLLTLVALIWLIARERGQVWRRKRFYLPVVALVAILAFPLLMRYRPAVQAAHGVELRVVEQPGLLAGTVKRCQTVAEIRECQYEPLGWAAQTLVYRKWCDGYYDMDGRHPGDPQPPQAYHLDTGEISPFAGELDTLSRESCPLSRCVSPVLAAEQPFPLGYLPGQYKTALVSPDGRWVAFTAEHIYGPEDLLVISHE